MHPFSIVFLLLLGLVTLLRLWLAQRQITHVNAYREHIPSAFKEKISLADHHKAADYTTTKTRFSRIHILFDAALTLAWTLGGGLAFMQVLWENYSLSPLITGIGVIISVMLISALLDIPLSLYKTFIIEARFGFNRTTLSVFILDLIKGAIITLILGIPLIAVILWLMQTAGQQWWLYAWLFWMSFNLFILWAYPAFIAPLFNKFTPLDNSELKQRIHALLERCGFKSDGIFVMDGSRRTGHGNAYFTGLGKNKRIVFYDTLLESLKTTEIEAVLAHELGHFKRKHIHKNILLMAIISFLGLCILAWLKDSNGFYIARS